MSKLLSCRARFLTAGARSDPLDKSRDFSLAELQFCLLLTTIKQQTQEFICKIKIIRMYYLHNKLQLTALIVETNN